MPIPARPGKGALTALAPFALFVLLVTPGRPEPLTETEFPQSACVPKPRGERGSERAETRMWSTKNTKGHERRLRFRALLCFSSTLPPSPPGRVLQDEIHHRLRIVQAVRMVAHAGLVDDLNFAAELPIALLDHV